MLVRSPVGSARAPPACWQGRARLGV